MDDIGESYDTLSEYAPREPLADSYTPVLHKHLGDSSAKERPQNDKRIECVWIHNYC